MVCYNCGKFEDEVDAVTFASNVDEPISILFQGLVVHEYVQFHFCSVACLRQYLRRIKRMAGVPSVKSGCIVHPADVVKFALKNKKKW